MQIDQTTLTDLSIFNADEDQSVFNKLNHTSTDAGKFWLKYFFTHPFDDLENIVATQKTVQSILLQQHLIAHGITNGTLMVLQKFYDSAIDDIPRYPNIGSAGLYKLLHGPDYSIIKYTVGHCVDFVIGLKKIISVFKEAQCPKILDDLLKRIQLLISKEEITTIIAETNNGKAHKHQTLRFGFFLLNQYRASLTELIDLFGKFDAYHSMAIAMQKQGMHFPFFENTQHPVISAKQLFHILLPTPVAYDMELKENSNFIFLTGANMAGKSTFIKGVGVAVYLAHLGMGVPAAEMRLSLFHGLLSNIQVSDNIAKGESYFFNEVQRIKNTIIKINNGKKWLVLIDELFKGTNVQDAMKCSSAVIQGLVKMHTSLFILSTHLYEIGEDLKAYPNIAFRYFETAVLNDQLSFSYQLKNGVSNDRIGYLILKREKVVALLEGL